jgi:hypothetical protein
MPDDGQALRNPEPGAIEALQGAAYQNIGSDETGGGPLFPASFQEFLHGFISIFHGIFPGH